MLLLLQLARGGGGLGIMLDLTVISQINLHIPRI